MSPHSTIRRDQAGGVPAIGVHPAVDAGRLATYTVLAASVAALPLPWLPDSLLYRIRGAVAHDVAGVRGLSLTAEARDTLAQPSPDGPRGLGSQALRYLGVRFAIRAMARLGPVALLWPIRDGLRTYVLGRLFGRYLEVGRAERAVRIDVEEARLVRRAIDGAMARAFTVEPPMTDRPAPIDDQRDTATALVDTLLGLAAGVPNLLMRRLDAAFDDLLKEASTKQDHD
jgi:hypothetical protein